MTELRSLDDDLRVPLSEKRAERAEVEAALARTGFARPAPALPDAAEVDALWRAAGRLKDELTELRQVRGLMRRLGPALRRIQRARRP